MYKRLIYRFNRISLPGGVARNLVPAHHQRARSNRRAGMNMSCWQGDGVRSWCGSVVDSDRIQTHHAILEEVGLHDGAWTNGGTGADVAEFGFGEPVRLNPGAAADFHAEQSQRYV